MIPQRNLSLVSNRLAAQGGRRIPEDVVERDYCLAWFLASLANSPLSGQLAFKGGTALKRCYFGDYRFSEDLDFTLLEPLTFDELKAALEDLYAQVHTDSGIQFNFDREDRHKHGNTFTFYLHYVGPLPRGSDVKVDVTLREDLIFPVLPREVLRGYDEYVDLPAGRLIRVYALEEIAAEKLVALTDAARNEPRDLFDLWYLTQYAGLLIDEALVAAVHRKLLFRSRETEGLADSVEQKAARIEVLWTKRLAYQMTTLPPFDDVLRAFRRALRQSGL
jgi:predicted nucleotidyltransferase component of viral defense system